MRLVLALMLALAASVASAAEVERIRFWAMGREGEVVRELIPEFERRHPRIRVEVQQLPWTGAHAKLLTAFAGDSTPDVAQLGNTWLTEMVTLGALVPLDARLSASRTVALADYFPGVLATNRIDGVLYGLPWYVDTRILYFRRDLLRAAGIDTVPTDWRQWYAAMAAVKAYLGPNHYAILLPLNEFEPLLALGLQHDAPLLRAGGRHGNFSDPGFRAALDFYLRLFRDGLAIRASNTQIANVWNEFDHGLFAFYISGPWNIGEFRRRLPENRQALWATAPLPGPDGPGASNAGGSSLVLFAGSRHQDAGWALIEYLAEPGVQRRFYALTGDLPPRRSSWDTPLLADDEAVHAFREQLERVRPVPQVPEWEQIATEMQLHAERAVLAGGDAQTVGAELDARVDAILAKRRWLLDRGQR